MKKVFVNPAAGAEAVGLIAGAGRMPMLTADGILAAGHRLVVCGLSGLVDPRLAGLADAYAAVGVVRPGQWIRHFRKHGVRRAVMIGSVRKSEMYSRFRLIKYLPDLRAIRLWYGHLRHDKRDEAALLAITGELQREGIELMSSVEFCKEHLADDGLMTRTAPGAETQRDIDFAWPIARESARLDIGQSLAVKERDIIAVEAIEGTDAMIARAGDLCKNGGWTLIKVARPNQDMRFDVPTVGPETIRRLAAAGCKCVVLEAGKTLIAEKPATLALADKSRITIMGKI